MRHARALPLAAIAAALIAAAGLRACPASAQNLAGVFGPGVTAGDRSVESRAARATDGDGAEVWAYRVHYQRAVSEAHRGRVVAQTTNSADGELDLRFLQGEWQWQFLEGASGWASALRLDGALDLTGDEPDRVGLNWTNQVRLSRAWSARLLGLTLLQVGDGSADEVAFSARGSLMRSLGGRASAGVEMFSTLGDSRAFGRFDDQNHQIGPAVSAKLGWGWETFAGVLFGASETASDVDARLWFTRALTFPGR